MNTICYNSPTVKLRVQSDQVKKLALHVKVKTNNIEKKGQNVLQIVYVKIERIIEINKRKNEIAQRELKLHCSFTPKIKKRSLSLMKNRKETKGEIYSRLSKSTTLKN